MPPSSIPLVFVLLFSNSAYAQQPARAISVAILTSIHSPIAERAAAQLRIQLRSAEVTVEDLDQSAAAAGGAGYKGSLNLTTQEAQDLGAVLGTDFYVLTDTQTVRRSPSSEPPYFESYCTVFVVSSRAGSLVTWQRKTGNAPTADEAEQKLLRELSSKTSGDSLSKYIAKAWQSEGQQRIIVTTPAHTMVEAAPEDDKAAAAQGLRLPRPFQRLRPAYTNDAASADVEATVDVVAEIDEHGDVTRTEIQRWAGFGLDESTQETVRQIRFFPAQRNGVAIPIKVLLRYNFRRSTNTN